MNTTHIKNNSNAALWLFAFISCVFIVASCNNEPSKNEPTQTPVKKADTLTSDFMFEEKLDTVPKNGEYISYYKSGVKEMQGMMKDGKREGLWKSFYEDGTPWSETNYKEGLRNGKTTTWYNNKQKRYEGSFADGHESGTWTYWDEAGKLEQTKEY